MPKEGGNSLEKEGRGIPLAVCVVPSPHLCCHLTVRGSLLHKARGEEKGSSPPLSIRSSHIQQHITIFFCSALAASLHSMTQHLQYRCLDPPTEGGGVTGAK